jgi:hypothetical protein
MSKYNNDAVRFIEEFKSHKDELKTDYGISVTKLNLKSNIFEHALYDKIGHPINDMYSNPFLIKSEYSVQEYYIFKNLGFDFFQITMALDLFRSMYTKFELMDIYRINPFEFVKDFNTFGTAVSQSLWNFPVANYYTQDIVIGPYLHDGSIALQYFIDVVPDGTLVPRAKISIPIFNENSFNIIVDNNTNHDVLEKIIQESILIDFKVVLKGAFDDDIDLSTINYESALQYLELIKMQRI